MKYILQWAVLHLIGIGVVVLLTFIALCVARKCFPRLSKSKVLRCLAVTMLSLSVAIALFIGTIAILATQGMQYKHGFYEKQWAAKMASLRRGDPAARAALDSPTCSNTPQIYDDRILASLSQVAYSIKCDPNHSFALEAVKDADPLVRYGALRSWMMAFSTPHKTNFNADSNIEMVRRIGGLISEGKFPSEIGFRSDERLYLLLRQYLRGNNLISVGIWNDFDTSTSSKIYFKQVAQGAAVIWFAMTKTPLPLEDGGSVHSF